MSFGSNLFSGSCHEPWSSEKFLWPSLCNLDLGKLISLRVGIIYVIFGANLFSVSRDINEPPLCTAPNEMQYSLKISFTARNPAYSGVFACKFKSAFDRKPNR